MSKIYLYVDFNDKDEAKKLGAKFDNEKKSWFITKDQDVEKFSKFLQKKIQKLNYAKVMQEFCSSLLRANLDPNSTAIITDGKWHRISAFDDKYGKKSGAYVFKMDDYPTGFITNHKNGYKEKFLPNKNCYDNEFEIVDMIEYEKFLQVKREKYQNLQKIKEEELIQNQLKTSKIAQEIYKNSSKSLSIENLYLKNKDIKEIGNLGFDSDKNIIIPLYDFDKFYHWSNQVIFENGFKMIGISKNQSNEENLHSRKKECFHPVGCSINDLKYEIANPTKSIVICEGYATAYTLNKATNRITLMAVDANNLYDVAKRLKRLYKGNIIVACDNDLKSELKGKDNIGLNIGKKIKEELGLKRVVYPKISNEEANNISDFNDLAKHKGINEVTNQILKQIDVIVNVNKEEKKIKSNEGLEDMTADEIRLELYGIDDNLGKYPKLAQKYENWSERANLLYKQLIKVMDKEREEHKSMEKNKNKGFER